MTKYCSQIMDMIHPGIVNWERVVLEDQMAKGVQRKYEVWSIINLSWWYDDDYYDSHDMLMIMRTSDSLDHDHSDS